VIADSGHLIANDKPQAVIEAIEAVLDSVTGKTLGRIP
jgi:hypothetical protein